VKNRKGYLIIRANSKVNLSTLLHVVVIDLNKTKHIQKICDVFPRVYSVIDRIIPDKKLLKSLKFNIKKLDLYEVKKHTKTWVSLYDSPVFFVDTFPFSDLQQIDYNEIYCIVDFKSPDFLRFETPLYVTEKVSFSIFTA